jgi:hypothetical protein
MAAITLTTTVTRTELSLASLDVNSSPYKVMSIAEGGISMRRQTAESPYVDGRTLTAAVKDTGQAMLAVRVSGTSAATVRSNIQALVAAFQQFEYTLTVVMDSTTIYTWTCEPADYEIGSGGEFSKFHWLANQQEVFLTIPFYNSSEPNF